MENVTKTEKEVITDRLAVITERLKFLHVEVVHENYLDGYTLAGHREEIARLHVEYDALLKKA